MKEHSQNTCRTKRTPHADLAGKKDAKVSQAQLLMPPAVLIEAFMGALKEWKGKKPDEPRGTPCHKVQYMET